MSSRPLAFVSLKAFGDLIIEQYSLRRIDTKLSPLPLTVIGDHLVPLYQALNSGFPFTVLKHLEGGVPAIFDARIHGWKRSFISAIQLRRLIDANPDLHNSRLVFYRDEIRERFMAAGRPIASLSTSVPNVYLAFDQIFSESKISFKPFPDERAPANRIIGIFAGSRVPSKNLPADIISRVFSQCRDYGLDPKGFVLDGEEVAPSVAHEFVKVPRSFVAMREAVNSVDAIVSADSMPAHMANYYSIPAFVLTPVENQYWMPYETFNKARWMTFADFRANAKSVRLAVTKIGFEV